MSARIVPFTNNRQAIYDLLTRAKRFHCPVSGVLELDVTELLAAIERARGAGRSVGLVGCLVRATALLLKRYPRLNHHLFHGLFRKREVAFDSIDCNLVVMREGEGGEQLLFPVVLRGADALTLEEIQATIRHHKTAPLDSLPQMEAIRKIERAPRLALRWFSYKVRSDHRFYLRYFGTYGLSSLITRGWGPVAGHAIANTGSSFFPGTLSDRALVIEGKVVVRKVLHFMIVADHYILDGLDVMAACEHLRELVTEPGRLGLDATGAGVEPEAESG